MMKFCVLKDCPDYSFVNSHVERHVCVLYHNSNQQIFSRHSWHGHKSGSKDVHVVQVYIIILKMTEAFSKNISYFSDIELVTEPSYHYT